MEGAVFFHDIIIDFDSVIGICWGTDYINFIFTNMEKITVEIPESKIQKYIDYLMESLKVNIVQF